VRSLFAALVVLLAACSAVTHSDGGSPDSAEADAREAAADATNPHDASTADTSVRDAAIDVNKAAPCATSFGSVLTNAFGRLDGIVLAVVPPNDQTCAMPNMTHLVIQVTMNDAAYRMVVDVLSDFGNPDVSFYEVNAPLKDGAWQEGWHAAVNFDYVLTLGLHSASFTAMTQANLVAKVTSEIALGSKISFFATSMDEPTSAHLVHRNLTNQDGAIVLGPDTASPHYLLFSFSDQSF
jgi:hypothetical protein